MKTLVGRNEPRTKLGLLFIIALLVLCDGLLFKSAGWARVAGGLIAYAGLAFVFFYSRLKPNDIGLSKSDLKAGLALALKIVAALCVALAVVYLLAGSIFKDPRYNQSIGSAFIAIIFALPLKTVIFEELAFRGIMPALIEKIKTKQAAILYSSLLFGLWHLSTGLGLKSGVDSHGTAVPSAVILLAVFLATSSVGYILCLLRYKSKSLLTPLILHWFINASAIMLAALSWR